MSNMIWALFSKCRDLPFLVYAAIGLTTVWVVTSRKRFPKNIPPYPTTPYPILGHIPYLKSARILQTFREWRKKTGDIFSMKIGSRFFIVFNNCELMKEAFVKKGEFFADRPAMGLVAQMDLKTHGELKGIILNNGPSWKEQRSVSMQILREFGMGKDWLSEKVTEEVQVYLDTLSELKGQPKDVRLLTNAAVSNVICAILLGHRFELEDPDFVKLLALLNEQVTLVAGTALINIFPFLLYLPGDWFNGKKINSNFNYIVNLFSVKFLEKAKASNDMNNFIGSYYNEMDKKQKSGLPTSMSEVNLIRVMSNLFGAGSETTSSTIMWAMMFALHNPKAQEKFHQEIEDIVGTQRPPNMHDKRKMSYANAFIMETQRMGSIVPLSGQHLCTKTVEVGGYTIPEGTVIIPNLDAVLKDEKTWGDPLVFRPERFLDENNKVVVPEQFIPFSIGRRYCMGESLAKMELFLFISGIFQRFHILPEDPENIPPPDAIFGLTSAPKAFTVRLVERI